MRTRRPLLWIFVAVLLARLAVASLSAHPASTTSVTLVTHGTTTFDLLIVADADPLIAKLEVHSGAPPSMRLRTPTGRAARLGDLQVALLGHLELIADDTRVDLRWQGVEISDSGQATIRLTGHLPPAARTVRWRASFVFGAYPLVVQRPGADDALVWLQGDARSDALTLGAPTNQLGVVRSAIALGFTHILPKGLDHILFVLGLFLLSTGARQVLLQVSAFTLAHSITLGLGLYGVVAMPSHVVEPLIALSVAYVGVENLITSKLQPWRVVVVFACGLLHGMGFAEALANLHLQRDEFLSTLISFNVGVEAGQLTVIGLAALALWLVARARKSLARPVTRLASAAIGLAGLAWTIERLLFIA